MKNLRLLAMAFVAISGSVFAELSKSDIVELVIENPEYMVCIAKATPGIDIGREIALKNRQAKRK